MIWLYLSFAEKFAKFIVSYHAVLSPFLSAKALYLLLHFYEKFGPTFERKRRLRPVYFIFELFLLQYHIDIFVSL